MKESLIKGIKSLDMHSNGLRINLNKNETQFHLMGLIFTISVVVITVLSKINLIKDYLYKQNATIKQYNREVNSEEFSDFKSSDIMFIIYKVDFVNSKIIPIKFEEIESLTVINQNYKFSEIEYQYLGGLVKCSKDDLDKSNIRKGNFSSNYHESLFNEYSLCIKFIDQSDVFSFNNNKNLAISLYNIKTDADLIYTEVYIKESELNHNNYDNPVVTKWNLKSFYSSKGNTMHNIILKKISYSFNNLSFLFESLREDIIFYNIDNISEGFYIQEIKDLSTIHIRIFQSFTNSFIEVRYVTIDEVISSLGGSFSVIFFFIHGIYSYFFDFLSKVDLINTIFYYKEKKRNDVLSIRRFNSLKINRNSNIFNDYDSFKNDEKNKSELFSNSSSNHNRMSDKNIIESKIFSKNVSNTENDIGSSISINKCNDLKSKMGMEIEMNNFDIRTNKSKCIKEIKINEIKLNNHHTNQDIHRISYYEGFMFSFCSCFNNKSKIMYYYNECIEATQECLNVLQILNLFKEMKVLKKSVISLASENHKLIQEALDKNYSKYEINNPKEVMKNFNFRKYIDDEHFNDFDLDGNKNMNSNVYLSKDINSFIKLVKTEGKTNNYVFMYNKRKRYIQSNNDMDRFKKTLWFSLFKDLDQFI